MISSAEENNLCNDGLKELESVPKQKLLFELAGSALRLLQSLHTMGLVHGDIHSDNLVYSESPSDLKLIDFGRTYYYRKHKKHIESPPATKYNPNLLSPWEVKEKNKSRRDDILLEAGGYDDKFLSDFS